MDVVQLTVGNYSYKNTHCVGEEEGEVRKWTHSASCSKDHLRHIERKIISLNEQPPENVECHFVCYLANGIPARWQIFPGPVFCFHAPSWKEDLCINVCSWIYNSMNMGGEKQLSAQSSCVLLGLAALGCVQPSCWELAWSHEGRTHGPTEPEMQSGIGVSWTVPAERTQNRCLLYSEQSPQWVEEGILIFCPWSVCFARELKSRGAQSRVVYSVCCRSCSAVLSGEGEADLGTGTPGKPF